jgi:hypothetical protein
MDLVSVLRCLYESEIDVSIVSRWDAGWQLEIEGGQVARTFVDTPGEAAEWFHEQAITHFPESLYAKNAQRRFREALAVDRVHILTQE